MNSKPIQEESDTKEEIKEDKKRRRTSKDKPAENERANEDKYKIIQQKK